MSSYHVRTAQLTDAPAVAALHELSSTATYKGLFEDLPKAMPMQERTAYWRDAITYGEPQVQVVVSGEEIVGFVGFDRSRDPKTKPTVGEIWAIYVHPEHWGRGAGLALWDAAREGLLDEECQQVTIWIPLRNERALRFHELAGFKRELTTARTAVVGGIKIEEIRLKRALD